MAIIAAEMGRTVWYSRMKWLSVGLVGISLLTGMQAIAVSPKSQATLNRRLLADCMSKQMAASRTISYNDAAKSCKERRKAQADGLSASNAAKPANAR